MNKTMYMIGTIFIVSITIFLLSNIVDNRRPDDFETIKKEFESGDYNHIFDMPDEYYRMPEFYPFYESYKKFNQTGNAAYGYGAYPGKVYGNIEKLDVGKNISLYTLVHASYDVGSFQGIELYLNSPNDELFDTQVYPSDIMLLPIHVNSTDDNASWAYRIKMTIIAKKNIPKGEYVFKLDIRSPSTENNSRFYDMAKIYNCRYVNSFSIKPDKFFDFILNVKN